MKDRHFSILDFEYQERQIIQTDGYELALQAIVVEHHIPIKSFPLNIEINGVFAFMQKRMKKIFYWSL